MMRNRAQGSPGPTGAHGNPPFHGSIFGRIPNRIHPDPDPIWDPCCRSHGHAGPRVCWLGPEPQGTPNHTFSSPNGSPWHHLGLWDRDPTQNSGPDLAVQVPGPESQFFFPILDPEMPKSRFSGRVLKLLAPIAMDLGPQGPKGAQGADGGPKGPPKGPLGRPPAAFATSLRLPAMESSAQVKT